MLWTIGPKTAETGYKLMSVLTVFDSPKVLVSMPTDTAPNVQLCSLSATAMT